MKTLVPHPNVVARAVDETVVLVHLDTNRIFTLNPTGSQIWTLIVAGHGRAEIERALQTQYEVDPERLTHDLETLLEQFVRERLVTEGDSPAQ